MARHTNMFQVHETNLCKTKWKKGYWQEVGTHQHVSSKDIVHNANEIDAIEEKHNEYNGSMKATTKH